MKRNDEAYSKTPTDLNTTVRDYRPTVAIPWEIFVSATPFTQSPTNANRGDYSFNLNQQNDIQLKVNSNQGLAGEKYQSVITFNLTDAK